ncbi:MAG TPA: trypsin-like peptidase domain-containing protein [Ilumatobacteraceae bacterium]|nr:trypsin-like peptidase domain-containing protein [Ilumatobacteraceae bacterium]
MRVVDDDRIEAPAGAEDQHLPRRGHPTIPWLAWLGIALAVALGVFAVVRADDHPTTLTPEQISSTVNSEVDKGLADAQNVPPPGETAYRTIQPSMIYIRAKRTGTASEDTTSGAGVIVNASGQILTARHVVHGAESIEVTFADGSQSAATISSEEAASDIAVLVPDQPPSVIVPAVLGGGVQIGDMVFAAGHPLDLVDSLSAGVVSGLNRTVPIAGQQTLTGLIQFDAAVNPGSSGGPLLNRAGQVVGVVTALANPTDQTFFVGIGFAIPIATAGGAAGAPEQ